MGFKNWLEKVAEGILPPEDSTVSQNETDAKLAPYTSMERTIVIVEDEEITRKILEANIKKLGYECHCFSTASDALGFLKNHKKDPPYLIISDLMMDEGDGIDLLAQTREDFQMSRIPFVFLTGANKELFSGILANYKYDGFLNKPINHKDLSLLLSRFSARAA